MFKVLQSFKFKGGFERKSNLGQFDVYQNGFFLSQMIISCTYEGFIIERKISVNQKLNFFFKESLVD
jgi:hypothetical protein